MRLRAEGGAPRHGHRSRRRSRGSASLRHVSCRRQRSRSKGEIDEAIERLREAGYAYEAEGAVWFRSTAFGDDKDRVLVRSNGQHTYFAADCAYLVDKFARGLRSPDLRLGGRSPRRRRARDGRRAGARASTRARRAADLPVRLVPAAWRAREDEQARRHVRHPRRADRRGGDRRRAVPPADVQPRRDDQLRHRGGRSASRWRTPSTTSSTATRGSRRSCARRPRRAASSLDRSTTSISRCSRDEPRPTCSGRSPRCRA